MAVGAVVVGLGRVVVNATVLEVVPVMGAVELVDVAIVVD